MTRDLAGCDTPFCMIETTRIAERAARFRAHFGFGVAGAKPAPVAGSGDVVGRDWERGNRGETQHQSRPCSGPEGWPEQCKEGGGASGGSLGDVFGHELTGLRLGFRPDAPTVANLPHEVRVVHRQTSKRRGRHVMTNQEGIDHGSKGRIAHDAADYVGRVLRSSEICRTRPSLRAGAEMWDVPHMDDGEKTPLQLAVRRAIERSGKTRDALDRAIQERTGSTGKVLYDIERGKSRNPSMDTLRAIAEVTGRNVGEFATDQAPVSDVVPMRTVDAGETAAVLRLDLSYAMGPGTNLDDSYVEGEPVEFDLSFLRQLTPSPPDRLRIVNGVGDSMLPTLHDREDMIIDLNQRIVNMQDRIWVISLYGAGALKRLRIVGPGRVLVISDNPDVPDQEVDAEDITGRCPLGWIDKAALGEAPVASSRRRSPPEQAGPDTPVCDRGTKARRRHRLAART